MRNPDEARKHTAVCTDVELYYEEIKNAARRAEARAAQFHARMGHNRNRAYILWCAFQRAAGKLGAAKHYVFRNRRVK